MAAAAPPAWRRLHARWIRSTLCPRWTGPCTGTGRCTQAGVEPVTIALLLGHESIETTQVYLDANLEIKQAALDKVEPQEARKGRFKPDDRVLAFLKSL